MSYYGVVVMKNAFTLAEVLVTIGILGVVAAMTMPTLIGKHWKLNLRKLILW